MLKAVLSSSVLAIGLALAAPAADAGTLLFSFAGPDGSAKWTQASDPTPIGYSTGSYTTVPVTAIGLDSFGNVTASVDFYTPASLGGITTRNSFDIQEVGAQIYAGTEAAPIFSPGSYRMNTYDQYHNADSGHYGGTLTITAVPETATWALMLVGFSIAGAAMRSSRRRATASA